MGRRSLRCRNRATTKNSIVARCCSGGFLLGGGRGADAFRAQAGGKRRRDRAGAFDAEQFALLEQVSEVIIPATDTPGAIAAGVPAFMRADAGGVGLGGNAHRDRRGARGHREARLEQVRRRVPRAPAERRLEVVTRFRCGAHRRAGSALSQVQVSGAGRLLPVRNRRDAGAALRTRARRLALLPAAHGNRPRFGRTERAPWISTPSSSAPGSAAAGSPRNCASADCKTLVIERGRHVETQDRLPGFRHALGSAASRHGARGRSAPSTTPIQSTVPRVQLGHQAMVGASDSEHPYLTPEGSAVPLDPRLSPRRPLDHLGPPDLSHERHRFQRQQATTATASTGRSATRTSRRGTTASKRSPASPAANEGLEQLPDGQFLPPMELNCVELEFKQQARERAIRRAA